MEDPTLTYDPANLFSILLTDEVSSAQTTNKIDLVRLEAEHTAKKKNCIHKNDIFKVRIMCQEIARIQDFAPFTPELLGALSGPQNPGRKGHLTSRGGRLASQVFPQNLTHLVFQNLTALDRCFII